jgi:hypothetical protein
LAISWRSVLADCGQFVTYEIDVGPSCREDSIVERVQGKAAAGGPGVVCGRIADDGYE